MMFEPDLTKPGASWLMFKKLTREKQVKNYYVCMFELREEVILDVEYTSAKEVANEIGMSQAKFSHILQILRASLHSRR